MALRQPRTTFATFCLAIVYHVVSGSARSIGTSKKNCLEYVRYLPSNWENQWLTQATSRQNAICENIRRESKESNIWLEGVNNQHDLSFNHAIVDPQKSGQADSVWSVFLYRDTCSKNRGQIRIPVEPAVGLLRSPFAEPCGSGSSAVDVQDRNYMLLAPKDLTQHYPGRKLLFDLGTGSSFQSSLSWFVDSYARNGVAFDEIWAWEALETESHKYWRSVPEEYVARLHFYNTFASDQLVPSAPLEIIRSHFKQGDFIVVKLDIDNEILENSIMKQMLSMKHMIGELFFEKHFDAPEMHPYFGELNTSFTDTLKMFHEFRSAGIRLHYWP